MKAAEEDMTINCSREDSDLILENMFIDNWNSLPTGCVNCKTIDTFKKHVSAVLESGVCLLYTSDAADE